MKSVVSPKQKIGELEAKVEELSKKVEELSTRPAAPAAAHNRTTRAAAFARNPSSSGKRSGWFHSEAGSRCGRRPGGRRRAPAAGRRGWHQGRSWRRTSQDDGARGDGEFTDRPMAASDATAVGALTQGSWMRVRPAPGLAAGMAVELGANLQRLPGGGETGG